MCCIDQEPGELAEETGCLYQEPGELAEETESLYQEPGELIEGTENVQEGRIVSNLCAVGLRWLNM